MLNSTYLPCRFNKYGNDTNGLRSLVIIMMIITITITILTIKIRTLIMVLQIFVIVNNSLVSYNT